MALATVPPSPARRFSANPFIAFYQSSIGKKIIVALTGLYLIVFVLGHLLGNLEIYLGQDRLNAYAQLLQELGPFLWAERNHSDFSGHPPHRGNDSADAREPRG